MIIKEAISKHVRRTDDGCIVISDGDYISSKGNVSVNIFWSEPRCNIGFYPIMQINIGETIYGNKEFGENPDF